MADPMNGVIKSINGVTRSIDRLKKIEDDSAKKSEKRSRRIPFDVDALTNDEVEELRRLIDHEDDLVSYSKGRCSESGPTILGMYEEFDRLGLATCFLDSIQFLSPMAHWAVEKHDQRCKEREADRKLQWRHDRNMAIIGALVGGVLGIAGTIFGVILGAHLGS